MSTLPQVSSERLGTGVPSRLPKVEVQRPVFTIQSGGPVAMPAPQFRPTPSAAPVNESKSNLLIEQTRPWNKAGNEKTTPAERQQLTNAATRPTASLSAQPRVRPVVPAATTPQSRLTAELPTAERKAGPAKPLAPQLPRPATVPTPAGDPARVLNFSIN